LGGWWSIIHLIALRGEMELEFVQKKKKR
jgi:hypothetical protein